MTTVPPLVSFSSFLGSLTLLSSANQTPHTAIPPPASNLIRPVLLITASNDPVGTPGLAEGSTRPYAPDLRVHQIESGHFLMLEKAEEVNEAMRVFFEE